MTGRTGAAAPHACAGFVTNRHELMAVSDLVLTKPGRLTSSEALAMGWPMFVLNPHSRARGCNSDFLLEHAAAAKALGKPQSAAAVCQAVVAS